ncbi:MAG: tRNA guanosine(15) transglycosylase TgtA [Thermoplasmata archaeon]|nr:MAG: tRNA guanosine(15) transglycosylase TgtA [Thermoplasmata archaeon]
MAKFEIKERDCLSRIGRLETPHGVIETPALLPVINPNKMLIEPDEMRKLFGVNAIITNSYIIYRSDKLRRKAFSEGIHSLLKFDGVIMTDSGTFQSHVYGSVDVDYLEIFKFQRDIGSDIGTILDLFTEPDDNRTTAKRKVIETVKRAKKSVVVKDKMLAACTVQGGVYEDLRARCAEEMGKIDCDIHPVGGVVPLMENQRYDELVRCIVSSKMHLPLSRPVHLFGAGHPIVFPLAVALGVDMMDSSSYAKYARDERFIFPWGTKKLQDMEEIPCNCPVCSRVDAKELKEMNKEERERNIALHNLYICFSEMKRIKLSIKEGGLWELVEEKASINPLIMDALRFLERENIKEWLERFEPVSRKFAFFYINRHSMHRPIVYRYQKRLLSVYKPSGEIIIREEVEKPYGRIYREEWERSKTDIVIKSPFGPVPLPLDEMYPIAQSVFPKMIDKESEELAERILNKLLEKNEVKPVEKPERGKRNLDIDRVRLTVDMQFGKGVSDILLDGEISIKKSRSTGKIRNVFVDGRHILSMRAQDGMFTLKIAGARILHEFYAPPRYRVIVENDVSRFIREGRNVFAKFVIDCDPNLRPYDECIVVNEKDELLAVGRCLLNREEMLSFNHGIAVKVREGLNQS